VRIPTTLRPLANGALSVTASGETVGEVLADLESQFPGFAERILDENGQILRFVNVFVGDTNARGCGGVNHAVEPHAELSIVAAVAGG